LDHFLADEFTHPVHLVILSLLQIDPPNVRQINRITGSFPRAARNDKLDHFLADDFTHPVYLVILSLLQIDPPNVRQDKQDYRIISADPGKILLV